MEYIKQIIEFLDIHAGSLTFIVTFVYVVATIFICMANIKSANATREQVTEHKRQFDETNRAFVTVNFDVIRSGLAMLHIQNHGKLIANNVKIDISKEFIDNVQDVTDRECLKILTESTFSIGIGQSWYCCIGSHLELERLSAKIMHINLSYSDNIGDYKETISIDLSQYFWSMIYDSSIEDISQHTKKQTEIINKMNKNIEKIANKEQNNG